MHKTRIKKLQNWNIKHWQNEEKKKALFIISKTGLNACYCSIIKPNENIFHKKINGHIEDASIYIF